LVFRPFSNPESGEPIRAQRESWNVISSYLMYFDVNNLYGWSTCQHHCLTQIIDRSTILQILTSWILRYIPRQVTFSKLTYIIRNIFTLHILTYRSVRRTINRPASGKTNSSQLYTIRSAASYIIVTYSSVLVTVSVSQKFSAYCNSHNLLSFASISSLTRILVHSSRIILRKIYTNWWIMRFLSKSWRNVARRCATREAMGKPIRTLFPRDSKPPRDYNFWWNRKNFGWGYLWH